jgi:hypothetical protein
MGSDWKHVISEKNGKCLVVDKRESRLSDSNCKIQFHSPKISQDTRFNCPPSVKSRNDLESIQTSPVLNQFFTNDPNRHLHHNGSNMKSSACISPPIKGTIKPNLKSSLASCRSAGALSSP